MEAINFCYVSILFLMQELAWTVWGGVSNLHLACLAVQKQFIVMLDVIN